MHLKNCDAQALIAGLNGRKIICFGAGSVILEAAFEALTIPALEQHIAFFVDNDMQKWGKSISYQGHTYEIASPACLQTIDTAQHLLLITCMAYKEIVAQLDSIAQLDKVDCYLYNCVLSLPTLDVAHFFRHEVFKPAYADYQSRLEQLNLKDLHKGKRCFIVGNGPSLRAEDLELIRDEISFAANRIFLLFEQTKWRPTYYCCIDYLIYALDAARILQIDCERIFVPLERALAAGQVHEQIIYFNREIRYAQNQQQEVGYAQSFDFSCDVTQGTYAGQTVVYDLMQFAYTMGFSEVYLLGMDHTFAQEIQPDGTIVSNPGVENHFSKEYDAILNEKVAIIAPIYATTAAFQKAKQVFEADGRHIYNATRGGKLEVFPRVALEDLF